MKRAGGRAQSTGFLEFLLERNPGLLAHHPLHPAFGEHVWTFRGLAVCKGCTATYAGVLAGGLAQAATGWVGQVTDVQAGLVFVAMLLPTVATSLLQAPRAARLGARFVLGVLMASAVTFLFVTESWAGRVAVVLVYLAVRVPLDRRRRRMNRGILERWSREQAGRPDPAAEPWARVRGPSRPG